MALPLLRPADAGCAAQMLLETPKDRDQMPLTQPVAFDCRPHCRQPRSRRSCQDDDVHRSCGQPAPHPPLPQTRTPTTLLRRRLLSAAGVSVCQQLRGSLSQRAQPQSRSPSPYCLQMQSVDQGAPPQAPLLLWATCSLTQRQGAAAQKLQALQQSSLQQRRPWKQLVPLEFLTRWNQRWLYGLAKHQVSESMVTSTAAAEGRYQRSTGCLRCPALGLESLQRQTSEQRHSRQVSLTFVLGPLRRHGDLRVQHRQAAEVQTADSETARTDPDRRLAQLQGAATQQLQASGTDHPSQKSARVLGVGLGCGIAPQKASEHANHLRP